jgi:hypothetical protein
MREILILRNDAGDSCCFAVFNRKVGWCQYDYAKELLKIDPLRADGDLDGQPARLELDPTYQTGMFQVTTR